MQKHFLATISNDVNNLFGVRFLCSFFSKASDYQVTLLHISSPKTNDKNQTNSTLWDNPEESPNNQPPPPAVTKSLELLKTKDIPLTQVTTKTVQEKFGKVQDILKESSNGLYDAVVLGKRASYTLQWIFERATDETVLKMIKDTNCVSPLWICPDVDPKRKNVLLCIDGSANSFRTVDHVGFILSAEKQHTITLFYVDNNPDTESLELFEEAEAILKEHNIDPKQILRKITRGSSVSSTIKSELHKGGYAVVALGMRGHKGSSPNLVSKTTGKLISVVEKASLWCVP